jgi:sigma-B regulation protein RsbU (phosphoserine phosphatase)
METYLHQAPCIYFVSTDNGTLVDVNETLCSHLGFQREALIGQKLDKIFTISTRIFQQTHFFPLLKMQGHAEEIYISLQSNEGASVPVLINAERQTTNGEIRNTHVGIIVQNRKKFEDELIAARKTAETALQENTALLEARKELQKQTELLDEKINLINNQNEELMQFNRVVSHDLQEPLRKLSIFSTMLLEENDRAQQNNVVKKLMSVTDQMATIISGLQQYVWLTETPPKMIEVHLDKLLLVVKQQIVKEFPGLNLIIETENLTSLSADWEQMKLLFYHLLSNAIRFRKKEHEVYVRISGSIVMLNQFRNIRNKYKYTEFVKLNILDDGIGFNSEYKEQVFKLFKRLHATSGRGIGLSLCKKIVESHAGTITIESQESEGTTVSIFFPILNIHHQKMDAMNG